eukprot:TRINITY_DN105942_c0_g1_i1.p1 TRINITY_DN105942_c0_g1~~TRINITY_DN105942_c0_g1_i1.p1  ORF type:complete len:240 (+),score=73.34 TRINITY_DN105942_c0_g1_i1:109-828(+)
MTQAEADFFKGGNLHRTRIYDDALEARREYKGNLNFSAYRQAVDRQYLGVVGTGQYYAKPWGNDSSNVQAVLNGPAYWKRVFYRPNIQDDFRKADLESEIRRREEKAREEARSSHPPRKSNSEPQLDLEKMKEPIADPYNKIKDNMRPLAERQGKPRIQPAQVGQKLNFFNTLENKYHMKAGGKNLAWNVSQSTHRSSKTEAKFITSCYFRTDTQAVLSGVGREPVYPVHKDASSASLP